MRFIHSVAVFALGLTLTACGEQSETGTDTVAPDTDGAESQFPVLNGVKTKIVEGFRGVIAESYQDSKEWWPEYDTPEKDAPNVIVFLLDDVGFAQVGSFGGLQFLQIGADLFHDALRHRRDLFIQLVSVQLLFPGQSAI